jgi:hypothetical protein
VILRAQTWRSVLARASGKCRAIKRLHFRHSRVGGNPSFPDNQDMDPRLRGGDEP